MEKTKNRYTTISISKELMKQINEYIKENKTYTSAGEFLRACVREKIGKDKQ
jgi:hypothetical protein